MPIQLEKMGVPVRLTRSRTLSAERTRRLEHWGQLLDALVTHVGDDEATWPARHICRLQPVFLVNDL